MFKREILRIVPYAIIILCWSFVLSANEHSTSDVRILIDVSGSMKQNDPGNLRQPSLRLLTGLLNNDNNAGIWTFGQYVNMLVPQGQANADWKEKARRASTAINSYGLRTNIEGALRDATWDWMSPTDVQQQRSLILLTDGLVDISDDAQLNQASRTRILDEILPKMAEAGVNIHTIALSEDADAELLSQLSMATQGIHTNAASSRELEHVFLQMFEVSTQAETLPVHDNKVNVDTSIKEMTMLIFHQPDDTPTRLVLPDGQSIDHKHRPANVNWHYEQNYDLVTIQHPASGTWSIEAKLNPDNRVVVVSDLKLEVESLPAHIGIDDVQSIDIRLSQQGKPIINKDFLHFIKLNALLYNKRGQQQQQWSLRDNGLRSDRIENDGIYTLALKNHSDTGQHELIIDVDGTTFNRQQRIHYKVFSQPVITAIETSRHSATVYASPISGLIDRDSIELTVKIDQESSTKSMVRLHQNEWGLTLDDIDLDSPHSATIHVTGTRGKQSIDMQLPPLTFGKINEIEANNNNAAALSPAPTKGTTTDTHSSTDNNQNDAETQGAINSISPLTITMEVIILNIIGAGLAFLIYRKFKPTFSNTHSLEELTNE